METAQIEQEFTAYLHNLGYSKSMCKQLPKHIFDFLTFTQQPVAHIDSRDILSFYTHLTERPNQRRAGALSESYINHHVYALKLFFRYQLETGIRDENPMDVLDFPRPSKQERRILTQEQIKALYAATETLQQRALLGLYYGCGLRRGEGVSLELKDVHFRSGLLYVRSGKGSRRRVVPMSEGVSKDLYNYVLNERFVQNGVRTFFTNKHGVAVVGNTLNELLKTLLERAQLPKDISLHSLRHSIATHLLENGLTVEYVRDFLGHKHLESTQLYTRVNHRQLYGLMKVIEL